MAFFYPVFTLRAAASRHICDLSLEFAVCLYSFTQLPHSYALLPSCNMQVTFFSRENKVKKPDRVRTGQA